MEKIREHRSLLRGGNLRMNSTAISPASFRARKAQFAAAVKDGAYLAEPENRGKPPANPLTDPNAMEGMMGMMKGNVTMMVSQTLIMGWINNFFSGYVISELLQFTAMLWHDASWTQYEYSEMNTAS
jgi:ER membrane protein complex subunit 3